MGDGSRRIRSFVRVYILYQLKIHECHRVVEQLADLEESDEESHRAIQSIANRLADERRQQFQELLNRLQITNENLRVTYDTIVTEVFKDDIHWGRIISFLVFSGALAVYCAQHNLEARVRDVITWTECEVQNNVWIWITEHGGFRAFIEHFDDGSQISLSQFVIGASVVAAVVAGGIMVLKNLF